MLLLVGARFSPRLPDPLLAVLLGAAAVALLGLEDLGVATVGAVPDAVPELRLPDLSPAAVGRDARPALGIMVVAYSDNVLTARAFAERAASGSTPTRSSSPSAPRTSPAACCRASR